MRLCPKIFLGLALAALSVFASLGNGAESQRAYRSVVFPLFVGQDLLGEVKARMIPDQMETLELEATRVTDLLAPKVDPSIIERLGQKSSLRLKDFHDSGLSARLDESTLEIRIEVPAKLGYKNVHRLSRREFDSALERKTSVLTPAPWSAFINTYSAQDWVLASKAGPTQGREEFRSDFDAALNIHDWVLESDASFRELKDQDIGDSAFKRGNSRVVRDWTEKQIRFQAGDLNYQVRGFQEFVPMVGISAASHFGLAPSRVMTPSGSHELLLPRRSTVRVFVNGQHAQTLELPPGKHDLRDYSFATGINRVRIQITDDTGKIEWIEIPFYYVESLLSEDIHEISYSLGMETGLYGRDREYRSDRPIGHVTHRYGLLDGLTLEGMLQANRERGAFGLGSIISPWAKYGSITLIASLNPNFSTHTKGHAFRAEYGWNDSSIARGFSAGLEKRSSGFARVGSQSFEPQTVLEGFFGVQQGIEDWVNLGLSVRRSNLGSRFTSITASKGFSEGLNASLTFTQSRDRTGLTDNVGSLWLTWAIPEKEHTVGGSYVTREHTARAEWAYTPPSRAGTLSGGAGVDRSDLGKGADARADWIGNRYKLGWAHDSDWRSQTEVHRSGLRLQSALVATADGIAISRPVTDSFLLAKGIENLEGHTLSINDGQASSDWLGPAVYPHLSSYRLQTLQVETPDAPVGASLPSNVVSVLPKYKSGITLLSGTKGSVLGIGYLPARLMSGICENTGQQFFTNREGKFILEGLTSGIYTLKLDDGKTFKFEIPKQVKQGIFKIEKVESVAHER